MFFSGVYPLQVFFIIIWSINRWVIGKQKLAKNLTQFVLDVCYSSKFLTTNLNEIYCNNSVNKQDKPDCW